MSSPKIKETPKKVYKSANTPSNTCRLCRSVVDAKYLKNLYNKANLQLLASAEMLYGGRLPCDDVFPRLICRPCERRLNNFTKFKKLICESQTTFVRTKRCSDISPSAPTTAAKSSKRINSTTSCRGLTFDDVSMSSAETQVASSVTTLYPHETSEEYGAQGNDHNDLPFGEVLTEINNELKKVARRESNSVLRKKNFEALSKLDFKDIVNEIRTQCPLTYMVLSVMIEVEYNTEKKLAPLSLMYGILMFKRCHELSRLQRVNTMLLAESDANTELYGKLNKYGICLDKTKKYTILDEIGNHFMDKVVEQVKAGEKFTFVLDNIDWDLKVHEMRSDNQNRSVHAVATTLLFDRVSSNHLPDEAPQQSLSKCDIAKTVSMTDGEAAARKQRYKIFAARILCEFIPAFSFLKDIAHVHLQSNYKDEMNAKSVVVPFPVVMKDEKKYAEVVDVLDQLETWIHEIYSRAGLFLPVKSPATLPLLPASLPGSSRPDQPLSHVRPVVDATDPLARVKVPCFGDQLTRVRFAGAKDLRAGSHNARDRLDHIYPIRIADWHSKRSFLKLIYKKLYRNSVREMGTLRYYREKLQRRNVTHDVKHFEECEQLFISVGRAYTVAALLQFFQIETTEGSPECNIPPYDVLHGDGDKELYFNTVLDKFVEEYLIPMPDASEPHPVADQQSTDLVKEYSLCLLRYFFILTDVKDAVREGDGDRLATLHKLLLLHFKSDSGYNTYAIEMLIVILQNEVFLTEAESHQSKWAATANWKGGYGNNLEMDLLQENINRDLKKGIKGMGANKTDNSIERLSRAAGGLEEIIQNFDEQVGIKARSSLHSHKSSTNDEQQVLRDLIQIKPFLSIENRKHDSFPDASSDTLATLKWDAFLKWLKHHKRNLLMDAPIEDEEN